MGGRYRMSDEYTQAANQIIDEISEYIEEEYDLKPKQRLNKILREARKDGRKDGISPALIYGEDYYAMEDNISNIIKNLVMREANRLVHKRVAKYRKTK